MDVGEDGRVLGVDRQEHDPPGETDIERLGIAPLEERLQLGAHLPIVAIPVAGGDRELDAERVLHAVRC